MNHICFGSNVNEDKFDFLMLKLNSLSDWEFVEEKVTMREAIHNMTFATFKAEPIRMRNPISAIASLIFGKRLRFGKYFKHLKENTRRLHAQFNNYI